MSRLERLYIEDTLGYIQAKTQIKPEIGLILGSGLGALADEIEEAVVLDYVDIPHFPVSTVVGHAGKLAIGYLNGKAVLAMQGRFHFYEGHDLQVVTYPVRVMQKLGVKSLIVTNAAGGINKEYQSGELMLIADHINLTGRNPLIGPNPEAFGPRFPDMSEAYSKRLRQVAHEVAAKQGFSLQEGIYVGLSGPSYETPAEIRYLRVIGGDAVGMSTVPEVIVARHGGMEVLGISCVTNMAAGVLDQKLDHAEVMETAERVKERFKGLVKGVVEAM